MEGSDGQNPWARITTKKYLSYVKQYWDWCRERELTAKPNQIIFDEIMPKANKTKAQRTAGKKANLPYSPEDCWKLYHAARDTDDTLAHMELTSVSHDRFTVED